MVITRFAPSPTGFLHVGNVRTALVNFLYSKKNHGKFILRFDDTDKERSKIEYVDQIRKDLEWLGLNWDQEEFQSARTWRYEEVKEELIKAGRLYECFETKEELEFKRKMLVNRGLPPIYDRAALKLSEAEKQKLKEKGITPHHRFLLKDEEIKWVDDVRGENKFDGKNLSDPIIFREDGSMTYILCSVVDDIDMKITNIVRGEDHVSNTAIQMQIFDALKGVAPRFAHLALIKAKEGGISKRDGGFAIKDLRAEGIEAMSINSFLSKIGTSDPIEVRENLQQLIEDFDIKKFGRSQAIYDQTEIENLNNKLIANLSFEQVRPRLNELNLTQIDEKFWNSVRNNIAQISDIAKWSEICHQKNTYPKLDNSDDRDYVKSTMDLLPEIWDEDVWSIWIEAVKKITPRKGKNLFMPLRKALTNQEDGPELQKIFYLLGREEVKRRLGGAC